ncbi:hypothetical protein ACFV16_40095 [Streptomyces massasporeus]|uniref:hypothetical protein n=1 Tax=Streptomyces massasporeus TaxID=67324 RepID=UPI00369B3005
MRSFVWLRLYQLEMEDAIPHGRRVPLWWTLRHPSRPLTYHAAHRMFERANAKAGTSATRTGAPHPGVRQPKGPPLPSSVIGSIVPLFQHCRSKMRTPRLL